MQEIAVSEEDFYIAPLYRLLCNIQNNREIYQLLMNNSAGDSFLSDMMQETPMEISELIYHTSLAVLESAK